MLPDEDAKETSPDPSRERKRIDPVPLILGSMVVFLALYVSGFGALTVYAIKHPPSPEERAKSHREWVFHRYELPRGASDVVEEGNNWVSYTLVAGGTPRRYLQHKAFAEIGANAITVLDLGPAGDSDSTAKVAPRGLVSGDPSP